MAGAAEDDLLARAKDGERKGALYWIDTVALRGGFVWEYSTDLVARRRGESGDLPPDVAWVQAGTPLVGDMFLRLYAALDDPRLLDGALAAGLCLADGQLPSGGWPYRIDRREARPDVVRRQRHAERDAVSRKAGPVRRSSPHR